MANISNEYEAKGALIDDLQTELPGEQVPVGEGELDLAHRVRRRGLRGLMRAFWWGILSAAVCYVAGMFDPDRPVYDHFDFLDFMSPIAQSIVLSLSYLVFLVWCFAHSPRFRYEFWEKVGAAIASIVSLISIVVFAIYMIVPGI